MSTQLGVHVGRAAMWGVLVRERRLLRAQHAARSGNGLAAELLPFLEGLLDGAHPTTTTVVLGAHAVATKSVLGFPPVRTPKDLHDLIDSNRERLFVGRSNSTTVGTLIQSRILAEAYDLFAVDEVKSVLETLRLRSARIVSECSVRATIVGDGTTIIESDGVRLQITVECGELAGAVRRLPAEARGDVASIDPAPTSSGDGVAPEYAIAHAATALKFNARLALHGPSMGSRPIARWRARSVSTAIAVSLALLAVAPFARLEIAKNSAKALLHRFGPQAEALARVQTELARQTTMIKELSAFQHRTLPASDVLAELTRVLPDSTAVMAVAMDSSGVSVVAVGASAMGVLSSMDRIAALSKARLSGPVTQEHIGARALERSAISAEWAR